MKRLLKPFWKRIETRLDAVVYAAAARAVKQSEPNRALADEVSLVLDAVMAEQFRLQSQVEALERLLHASLEARPTPMFSQHP